MYRRTIAALVACTAVLAHGIMLVPAYSVVFWAIAGTGTVAAILTGMRLHRPAKRLPWWFAAGAVAAMAAGDCAFALDADRGTVWADVADASYLAMFALLTGSLLLLTGASVVLRDRSRLLGELMFVCAVSLVTWVFLISPALRTERLAADEKSGIALFLIGDLIVLLTTARLLIAARGSWSLGLMVAGAGGFLVGDALWAAAEITGRGWQAGSHAELPYLLFYAAWGAAALHPSMADLTRPVGTRPTRLQGRSMALLVVSLLLPSVTLFVQSLSGRFADGLLIAVVSALLYLLVFTQLVDAIGRYRQAVARERGLRRACASLVAAADPDAVTAALTAAAGAVLPAGTSYASAFTPVDADPADHGARTVAVDALPEEVRHTLAGHSEALVAALVLAPDAGLVVPPRRGTVAPPPRAEAIRWCLAADPRVLAVAHDAIEVLAGQAALALERIALTDTINRRDNERYLRSVVRTTADVVLIVDPDERVRYASPSMRRVLGVEPPVSGFLRDIVHPEDHEQIAHTLESGAGTDVWHLRRSDGSRVTVEVSYRDLRTDRMVRGYVVTLHDMTERRAREAEAARRALESLPAGQNRLSANRKFR
jgi:PAS domain S-box-containing protein